MFSSYCYDLWLYEVCRTEGIRQTPSVKRQALFCAQVSKNNALDFQYDVNLMGKLGFSFRLKNCG